jgi:hypothetical protein
MADQPKCYQVFDEELGRWLRLPCALPHVDGLLGMWSALM